MLSAAAVAGCGTRLRPHRAALHAALRPQLGDGRLHRPAHACSSNGAERGAAIVGLNPLHALFPHAPGTRESVQPLEPPVSERPVPRSRADRGVPRVRGSAAAGRLRGVRRAPEGAARCGAGGLSRRGRGEDADAGAALCDVPGGASGDRQRPRARVARVPRPRGRAAAPPRAVRSAAGALPPRRSRRVGLASSGRSPTATPTRRSWRSSAATTSRAWSSTNGCSGSATASCRAWACAPTSWGSGSGCTATWRCRSTAAARKPGPTRTSTRSNAGVGAPPDRLQSGRAELGPAPGYPGAPAHHRLRAVHRDAARQHAPRRRAARRSRDGADAAVLDRRGHAECAGRVRALSAARPAGHPRAGEPAQPVHGDRRGSGHRARRDASGHARLRRAVLPPAVLRAPRGRRLQGARRVSRGGAGGGQHARPADAGGVLGRPRSAAAPGAGPVSERRGAPAPDPGARTGPRAPAARAAARGAAPGGRVARSRREPGDDAGA